MLAQLSAPKTCRNTTLTCLKHTCPSTSTKSRGIIGAHSSGTPYVHPRTARSRNRSRSMHRSRSFSAFRVRVGSQIPLCTTYERYLFIKIEKNIQHLCLCRMHDKSLPHITHYRYRATRYSRCSPRAASPCCEASCCVSSGGAAASPISGV